MGTRPGVSAPSDRREPGELFGPRFALFADMLAVGLFTTVASLPLITAPAALAAGCRVLRDSARTRRTATAGRYRDALRAHGLARTLIAGVVLVALGALFLLDLALAGAGLPGAAAVSVTLAAVGAVALLVGVRAAAHPAARRSWPAALRGAARRSATDPAGSVLIAVALVICAAIVWALPPLALVVAGPLALAAVSVELRAAPGRGRSPRR
ncbi:hypothetical protein ABTZ59_20095 [Streptomyces sp. NPDC094034]|uniref:hypothetical protein n=1 Tax=Streptomyces sp. NPDC094034 TaxID=3155309 RepID=UPI003325F8F1